MVQVRWVEYLPDFHVFRFGSQSPFSPSISSSMSFNLSISPDNRSLNLLNIGFDTSHLLQYDIDDSHVLTYSYTV